MCKVKTEGATLRDVANLANELMNKTYSIDLYGIGGKSTHKVSPVIHLGYRFSFDNAKSRFGACHYGNDKRITLSRHLCSHNLDKTYTKIKDTILHEIAHAICVHLYGKVVGAGHGIRWQRIAKQIGCTAQRCYDREKVNLPKSKYTATCPTCGNQSPFHRKPRRKYACSKCCVSGFEAKHQLVIEQNY